MAVKRTVRVIRTWEFTVDAEYGDDYNSLAAKVSEEQLDSTAPDAETRVVLEEHDSAHETLADYKRVAGEPADTSGPARRSAKSKKG